MRLADDDSGQITVEVDVDDVLLEDSAKAGAPSPTPFEEEIPTASATHLGAYDSEAYEFEEIDPPTPDFADVLSEAEIAELAELAADTSAAFAGDQVDPPTPNFADVLSEEELAELARLTAASGDAVAAGEVDPQPSDALPDLLSEAEIVELAADSSAIFDQALESLQEESAVGLHPPSTDAFSERDEPEVRDGDEGEPLDLLVEVDRLLAEGFVERAPSLGDDDRPPSDHPEEPPSPEPVTGLEPSVDVEESTDAGAAPRHEPELAARRNEERETASWMYGAVIAVGLAAGASVAVAVTSAMSQDDDADTAAATESSETSTPKQDR